MAGREWFARVSAEPAPPDAPPVVLVHGLGVSSRYMLPTARCLAPHVPTLAPDLPGFGRSERPERTLDVPGLADALAGWMQARGLPPVLLLANSLGCQVAVDLAVRHPALVGWLLLVGPSGDPDLMDSIPRYIGRLLLDLPRERPAMVLVEAVDYLRAGPRRLLTTARSMVRDPFLANLRRVVQPTLVMRGEGDPICPQRWAETVADTVPPARLEVVPGAAHVVNDSHPRALLDAVRALLADHPATSVAPHPLGIAKPIGVRVAPAGTPAPLDVGSDAALRRTPSRSSQPASPARAGSETAPRTPSDGHGSDRLSDRQRHRRRSPSAPLPARRRNLDRSRSCAKPTPSRSVDVRLVG